MFALTRKGGVCTSTVPDVCNTPSPSGTVPVPYVNVFQCSMVLPSKACSKVFIDGSAALHVKSETTVSNGDEAGVNGGVVSGKFIGKGGFIRGSSKVTLEGKPAVSQGAMTTHNNGNATGLNSMAAQAKVDIL
ncbi:MAG: DUF4150 domain-containing protein [Desulfovibrio sp.]|nr:DUF4150 domain-containing protein [Desulfovibrio sp.]